MPLNPAQFTEAVQSFRDRNLHSDEMPELGWGISDDHPAARLWDNSDEGNEPPVQTHVNVDSLTHDPHGASGTCYACTNAFLRHLRAQGADPADLRQREYEGAGTPSGPVSHAVAVVNLEGQGPTAVDWTHRQFDPKASVPHMQRVEHFDRRMRAHRLSKVSGRSYEFLFGRDDEGSDKDYTPDH